MLILALDTTSRRGSVAIIRDGRVLLERQGDEAMTHGQRLPAALMSACEEAGIGVPDLQLLAVAAGPGSFTGLRIGIASLQGLATARGLLIVPVSTLEAIAASAPVESGRVAAWMDAQRGEVFAQVFDRIDGEVRPLTGATSGDPADVLVRHGSALEGARYQGDGAVRYASIIHSDRDPSAQIATMVPPLAGAIGLLAAADPDRAVRPHAVVPIYVRRPDAEIARDRRSGAR